MTLFDIIRNRLKPIKNECGTFYVDEYGILQDFHPSCNNPFIEDEYENHDHYTYSSNKSIRNLIIPEGVKGFEGCSFRGIRVLEKFELPESLEEIGDDSFQDDKRQCVFAGSILPKVIIPENVKKIGIFAFGHCHINELLLPASIHSCYGRQFKDGYIGRLYLPVELMDFYMGRACREDMGWIRWPSTKVGEVVYYEDYSIAVTQCHKAFFEDYLISGS